MSFAEMRALLKHLQEKEPRQLFVDAVGHTRARGVSLPRDLAPALHPRDLPVDTHRLLYRFEQRDMPRLIAALRLPAFIVAAGCKLDSWHALCCALAHLALDDGRYVTGVRLW